MPARKQHDDTLQMHALDPFPPDKATDLGHKPQPTPDEPGHIWRCTECSTWDTDLNASQQCPGQISNHSPDASHAWGDGTQCSACGAQLGNGDGRQFRPCPGPSHTQRAQARTGGPTQQGQEPLQAWEQSLLLAPHQAVGHAVPIEERAAYIAEWWVGQATLDAPEVRRKAIKYGAADLIIMGQAMIRLLPGAEKLDEQSRIALGLEMAIAHYVLGKIARTFGSYEQGRAATDDDWYDLEVYAKMARFVRQHGRWM